MNWFVKTICLCILIVSFSACSKDPVEKSANEILIDEFKKNVHDVIEYGNVPGVIVGVWEPSRNLEWTYAEGIANLSNNKPITTSTLMKVGSITKTFVSTVLLQLHQEKKLSLDDKLAKYIPSFPKSDSVTLRMLCNMTTGIADYIDITEFINTATQHTGIEMTPEQIINYAAKEPYLFSPGTRCSYSNTNYIILGMVIEQVTENTLENEIKERITDKLGLAYTLFPESRYMPENGAHGYIDYDTAKNSDVSSQIDPSLSWAAGGIISNLENLRTWSIANANGILIADSVNKMRKSDSRTYMKFLNIDVKYGQGIMMSKGYIGHAGLIQGYSSLMLTNPELNSTVVILFNKHNSFATYSDPDMLFLLILNKLHPDLM